MNWKVGEYPKYAAAIREAERRNNIPPDLLARLLYQCSQYEPAKIRGDGRHRIGAIGIAQLLPDVGTRYNIDRTEPFASINAAAMYLAWLRNRFGEWRTALQAYHWSAEGVYKDTHGKPHQLPIAASTFAEQIMSDVEC